jgi:ATP-dependent Clp protease protease subunit
MTLIKKNLKKTIFSKNSVKNKDKCNKEKYIDDENSFENLIGFSEDKYENNDQSPNEYYLYSDISISSVMGLLKFIKNAEKRWNNFLLENFDIVEKAEPKPLKIYINSEGGEIFAAIPLIDAITNSKIPIHTYIEGIAASAASLISMSGHKRFISKNSFMLIHELRTGVEGTYSNLTDERENCDKLMSVITNFYKKRTDGKFSNEMLQSILKRDIILSSTECLSYGLVDEII